MKRQNGIYYTAGNPFGNPAFLEWAASANIKHRPILEPFAGSNSLIDMLDDMGLCKHSDSFDLSPANSNVKKRDTLKEFPTGYDVCVTNPPWLAKNSATVRGLPFPDTQYDDLYKVALGRCLENCEYVAALVPESFIRAKLFQDRLTDFVSLTRKMFEDTGHPTGLALFGPKPTQETMVWHDDKEVGFLSMLENILPDDDSVSIQFNVPNGNVGLIALDNTQEPSIRFCDVKELADYEVKQTGRHITKILVDVGGGGANPNQRLELLSDLIPLFNARCVTDVLQGYPQRWLVQAAAGLANRSQCRRLCSVSQFLPRPIMTALKRICGARTQAMLCPVLTLGMITY